jgi:hypothetical protein
VLFKMKMWWLSIFCIAMVSTRAAVISFGGSYSQNFDSFLGTSGTVPSGFTTTGTQTYKGLDDGGDGNGGYWSFGVNSASDRAFGMIETSSSVTGLGLIVALNNNTGSAINKFTLSYVLEEWRDGNGGSDRQNGFALRYSTDGTTFSSALRTDAAPLNNNLGKLNGNSAANRAVISSFDYMPAVAVQPGDTIYFEWQFVTVSGNTGARDGIGLDDFTITAVPEPATWFAGVFALAVVVFDTVRRRRARS